MNGPNKLNKKAFTAFTLAEILIVLGIIGIVAQLTIPALYANFQEQVYKTAYKKAFSVASQAWLSGASNNQMESRPTWGDLNSKLDNFNTFKSYFKVIKDCNNSNNSDCWANGEVYYLGCPYADALAFIDASGMAWSITGGASVNTGAELLVDTNGFKRPNKYGQDRFVLFPVPNDCPDKTAYGSCLGIPARIMPTAKDFTAKDDYFCPSGNTHPCYYTSWLYN